jgi:hypothetical protein
MVKQTLIVVPQAVLSAPGGYDLGPWTIPVPFAAALVGATAALLFALFKSFLDRRQGLIDTVSLLRAELENVERHTKDSFHTLGSSGGTYVRERLEMSQFPEGGLVTLKVRDLLGLPTLLIQDLMTLVIYLRNFNLLAGSFSANTADAAFDTQMDVLISRLMISQRWATDIRCAMKQNVLTGALTYAKASQTPTVSARRPTVSPPPS